MDDSIAHPPLPSRTFELPAWKSLLATAAAVLVGILFIVAGVWKITDPFGWATRVTQLQVPHAISMPATLLLGISETFAGVLLFVPRFRRWGAWLTGVLLVVFMIYVGYYYDVLRGEECSCFPWLKRTVGPGFFIGDFVMLAGAFLAGWWSRPSEGTRTAALILSAVSVFALASYGMAAVQQTGTRAPEFISVNGQPFSLQQGKVFIYFFDPECSHCYQAAQDMGKYSWSGAKVIGVPTAQPQFAEGFMRDTKMNAPISNDLELLKKTFPFVSGPYAVAIENGRQVGSFNQFEGNEPAGSLRKIGFVE